MSVTQYRAYHVGKDDRYKAGFNLNCADDQEAIAVAKRWLTETTLSFGKAVGRWLGCRTG